MPWLASVAAVVGTLLAGRPPAAVRVLTWSGSHGSASARSVPWLLAGIGGSAFVGLSVSPTLAAGAAVLLFIGWRIVVRRRASQLHESTSAAVVEVTASLAAELRAGRTPAEALLAVIDVAGPLQSSLRAAHAAVVIGGDTAAELELAAATPGAERLRPVAATWRVAASAGGRVAVVLERLAAAMDEDDELKRELDAALAGPRATMALLVGLPVFGIVLGQSAGADPVDLLLHRPLGWGLLAAAVVLDLIGLTLMRLIVSRAQAP